MTLRHINVATAARLEEAQLTSIRFDGRVALITGAGAGLGRAYAERLAARGAKVVVNDRERASAMAVVKAIRDAGGDAITDQNPIETKAGGLAMVQSAYERFGRLDILICNAGGTISKPILESGEDDFRENMNVNFWGTVHPVLAALPRFIDADYGRIVAVTSAAGLFGTAAHAPYSSSKMAVVGFAKALAVETGKLNIRVNVVSPYARTPGSSNVLGEELAELMTPDRVAQVVAWLAHERCDKTGMILSAGAGRVRRVGIVESPVVELEDEDIGRLWDRFTVLDGAHEPRNSADSARVLMPELAALGSEAIKLPAGLK